MTQNAAHDDLAKHMHFTCLDRSTTIEVFAKTYSP